jgi:hypothetical protein
MIDIDALLTAKHNFLSAHNSALISYYINDSYLKKLHHGDMMVFFENAATALGFTLTPIVLDPWQPKIKTDEVTV